MRVSLCDICRNNVNPQIDPNFIGHTMSIDIPEDFKQYRSDDMRVYDFCSRKCRAEWFAKHGKSDLTGISTSELRRELASREGVTEHRIGPHGDLARLHLDKVTN